MHPPSPAWQFETLDVRHVERWIAARPAGAAPAVVPDGRPSRAVRTYLDTRGRRLLAAGFALCVLRQGRRVVAELQPIRPAAGGEEAWTEEVRSAAEARGIARTAGPVGTRVRALGAAEPLRPVGEARVREWRARIVEGGARVGSVVVEDLCVPLDGRPHVRFGRVRIEAEPGADAGRVAPVAAEMQAALGLAPARTGTCEAVLAARGLVLRGTPGFGPTEIGPASSTGEAAFAVLRRQFAAFLANEPGTRLGDDPRRLHDVRVASRRLRAALSLFRDALPVRAQALREELKWIAGALGEVRDLDVQRARFEEWTASDPRLAAAGFAEHEIGPARERMTAALDSRRYRAFVRAFGAMLRKGPPARSAAARAPVVATGPELVRERRRRVRKAAKRIVPESPPEAYHELRIRCKRLRYAIEFLADVYGAPARDLAVRIAGLQDLLGRHQDAYVAIARIERLLGEGTALAPRTAFAMGLVAERCAHEAARLRRRFPRAYARTRGRPWRRLRRAMERLRPSPGGNVSTAGAAAAAEVAGPAAGTVVVY